MSKNQPNNTPVTPQKFEVGKEYINTEINSSKILKCIAVGPNWIIVQHGNNVPFVTTALSFFKEKPKEPRKLTFYVNIYERSNGQVFSGSMAYTDKTIAESEKWSGAKRIDTVPVEWVEKV